MLDPEEDISVLRLSPRSLTYLLLARYGLFSDRRSRLCWLHLHEPEDASKKDNRTCQGTNLLGEKGNFSEIRVIYDTIR
jgi:hypothetical protein